MHGNLLLPGSRSIARKSAKHGFILQLYQLRVAALIKCLDARDEIWHRFLRLILGRVELCKKHTRKSGIMLAEVACSHLLTLGKLASALFDLLSFG